MDLYIGQKNYSSWSLRPWILLKKLEIPFTEKFAAVQGIGVNPELLSISPSGLVPIVVADGLQVWDSYAIMEWLAEKHPRVWPEDDAARAFARCISLEMHSGFADLRSALPMNIKMRVKLELQGKVALNVERVLSIFSHARSRWGIPSGEGPFLFGHFTAADAMFAPVAFRFQTYGVVIEEPIAASYVQALLDDPRMKEWEAGALAEESVIAHYDAHVIELGGYALTKQRNP